MNPQPNPLISLFPIVAIFLIFYFLVIRPQQKQAKGHQKMLDALKKGDRVVTNGGLYGLVVGFRSNDIELKIADNVKVLLARSAVTRLVDSQAPAQQGGTDEKSAKAAVT